MTRAASFTAKTAAALLKSRLNRSAFLKGFNKNRPMQQNGGPNNLTLGCASFVGIQVLALLAAYRTVSPALPVRPRHVNAQHTSCSTA